MYHGDDDQRRASRCVTRGQKVQSTHRGASTSAAIRDSAAISPTSSIPRSSETTGGSTSARTSLGGRRRISSGGASDWPIRSMFRSLPGLTIADGVIALKDVRVESINKDGVYIQDAARRMPEAPRDP